MEIFLIGLIIAYIIALVINTVVEWRSHRTMEVIKDIYERQNELLKSENDSMRKIIISVARGSQQINPKGEADESVRM